MQERLFELADKLKALRDRKDALEAELKQVDADIDDTGWHLSNFMAENETPNFTRAGSMFFLTTKTRASAREGMKDELFTALRSEGFGDLVYETVNANSLSAFVKEQITENGDALPDWLDGLVNVFEKTVRPDRARWDVVGTTGQITPEATCLTGMRKLTREQSTAGKRQVA